MKNKLIIFILFILMFSLLSGCSSSNIKYQHIEGTSEEFSRDVYKVLKGYEDDLKNNKIGDYFKDDLSGLDTVEKFNHVKTNISWYENSVYKKFFIKYSDSILNKREQEVWDIVFFSSYIMVNSYLDRCSYNEIEYNDYEFKKILKDEAENILKEIQK